jgi:hypothetical protein
MKIEHFGGAVEIADVAALDGVLDARYGDDANEYWLYGEAEFPCLAICVRGSSAYLHFFPQADHPGFASRGEDTTDRAAIFFTNTPTETMEVSSHAVVPIDRARAAAQEFFRLGSLPCSLRWTEL